MEKVFFFRPGVDLSKVKKDGKYMNEHITLDNQEYIVFGNKNWTALKPVKSEPKQGKKTAKGVR